MFDAIRTPDLIKAYNKEHKTNHAPDATRLIPAVELYVKLNAEDKGHYHITAWAVTNQGYFNLMKLASLAYNDTVSYFGSVKARVTYDQIKQYKEGLMFGTGCIAGPIGQAIMKDKDKKLAEERFLMYKEMFGDNLFIEFHVGDVTHNYNKKTGSFDAFPVEVEGDQCTCDSNKQRGYNLFLSEMVEKHGGRCVPVTDAHFIRPEDKVIQDCLLKNGNTNGWYFYESYHQMQAEEMYRKLKVHLGDWMTEERFSEWIDNTYMVLEAAKSISIKFDYHLPKVKIPEHIQAKTPDYNLQTYYFMMELIKKHGRWSDDPVYIARFKQELDVIMKNEKLNFIPYFLLYEDIGSFARSHGILQNLARGSAGGSLISFYLKIIHMDPIKQNLPFERFLSHARIRAGSFPDIDGDIGHRDRGLILKYLQDKYGLGFAQIATFQKMKAKNAIKDAMYALYGKNGNDPEVVAICSTIPDSPQGVDEHDFLYGYTDTEGNYNAGVLEVNRTLANFFKQRPEVERMVQQLIGTIRGWGRHASAFVISTLDLSAERIPTMIVEDKELGPVQVTQVDAKMVESSGLVKADILGLSTLTAVSDCINLVKEKGGTNYLEEMNGVPLVYRLPEDKGVYTDFYNKDTDSSFQFNTELIKGLIQEFCPLQRADLSAMTALCRPGALDAPLYDTMAAQYYMDVRNGKREVEYLHPDLEPILGKSNGVFVYQEEVMRFLVEIAGYSWEESDAIRSAIAKKKEEVIMASFTRIRESCRNRGWTEDAIETVCQQIKAFSKYSFNKSHSAAYGELGYITMYLKHHHPLEWWASMLNLDLKEDKMRKYISKLGAIVQPASLQHPCSRFEVRGKHIVAPISVVKGVGPTMVKELITKGPFKSLEDLVARVNHSVINTGCISALVKGRAADDLMDSSIAYYPDRRKKFLEEYKRIRICKRGNSVKLHDDVLDFSPLSIFLMEKESNKVFNKTLLGNQDIIAMLRDFHTDEASLSMNALQETGRSGVPYFMGNTPVLANIKVAEGVLKKDPSKEVGMILLFEESTLRKGISKKNNKPWTKLEVVLSDGYNTIECVDWRAKKALGWPKNSIIYVRGQLSQGWRTPVQMNMSEIQRLTRDDTPSV